MNVNIFINSISTNWQKQFHEFFIGFLLFNIQSSNPEQCQLNYFYTHNELWYANSLLFFFLFCSFHFHSLSNSTKAGDETKKRKTPDWMIDLTSSHHIYHTARCHVIPGIFGCVTAIEPGWIYIFYGPPHGLLLLVFTEFLCS